MSTESIAALYAQYVKHRRVSTDTREIAAGDVFVALRGANFNGNAFAEQALHAGASVAFIDDPEYRRSDRCILVPDTLVFLQQTANYHRRQLNIPIIGITGTNGKTTTKELCNAVLSSQYTTCATKGNLNNHVGVPLSLLAMDESTELGIIEMGANHPGEIKALCCIAEPDYGLITNIGKAHLEGFGSYEGIIRTKRELYDYLTGKGGTLFVNADDPLLTKLSEGSKRVTYGEHGEFAQGETKQRIPNLVYSLKTRQGDLSIQTQLIGGYNFANAMAASCIGLFFHVQAEEVRQAIERYAPGNLRSQLIRTGRNVVIMDAYNANPSSMKAALDNFAAFREAKKIVILGEMLELGGESEAFHREIAGLAASYAFEKIFLVGKNFEIHTDCSENICYFADISSLIGYLKEGGMDAYHILVKGSRGNKLEQIVEYL